APASPTTAPPSPAPTTAPTAAPAPGAASPTPAAGAAAPETVGAASIRVLAHVVPTGQTPRDRGMKAIVEKVTAKTPQVKLQFDQIPWQQMQAKWLTTWSAGNATDVTLVDESLPQFIRTGVLADLTPYLNKWPKERIDDLAPKLLWQHGLVGDKKY